MNANTKKLLKILSIPFGIFMFYPIALTVEIVYALKTNQPEMDSNYYLIGSNYDAFMKQQNTNNRILESSMLMNQFKDLKIGENKLAFQYYEKNQKNEKGSPVTGGKIQLRLSRSATVTQDINTSCETDQTGGCVMQLDVPAGGYWEIHLQAQDKNGKITQLMHVDLPQKLSSSKP